MTYIDRTALTLAPADVAPVDRRAVAFWLTFWAAFAAADTYAHKRGRTTLSKTGRWLFRTETRLGRAAFTLAFASGAIALHRHVLEGGKR